MIIKRRESSVYNTKEANKLQIESALGKLGITIGNRFKLGPVIGSTAHDLVELVSVEPYEVTQTKGNVLVYGIIVFRIVEGFIHSLYRKEGQNEYLINSKIPAISVRQLLDLGIQTREEGT